MPWQQIINRASLGPLLSLGVANLFLAAIFVAVLRNTRVRFWFSELTRPTASQDLREALSSWHGDSDSAQLNCRLGLLYDKAGLRRQAYSQLKLAKEKYPRSLYTLFLNSIICYRRRDYRNARHLFLIASDASGVDGELKADLLAASACAAFAAGDTVGALNLSERALEFDYSSLVARMVKVDVFLRQGKREQAGEEILATMRLGLTLELENKVPLDTDRTLQAIAKLEEAAKVRQVLQSSRTA
jgi:tetratricopeptide (TPR) repeat protein